MELIIGLGIVAFLLLFFAFNVDKNHEFLKVLFIIFFFISLILIGKSTFDDRDYCSVVVSNSTDIDTDTSSYEYERVCFTNTNTTNLIFYRLTIFILTIFFIYLFVYISWKFLDYMRRTKKGK